MRGLVGDLKRSPERGRQDLNLIDTFRLQARLKSTFAVNRLLSRLKSLPLIGRLIPAEIYALEQLKERFRFPTLLLKLLSKLFKIFFYHGLIFFMSTVAVAAQMDPERRALQHLIHPLSTFRLAMSTPERILASFLTIWLFYSLMGAWLNRKLFPSSSDSEYYLIHFLRIPARRYLLMRYAGILLGNFILQTLSLSLFLAPLALPLGKILLVTSLYLSVNLLAGAIQVILYRDLHFITKERSSLITTISLIVLFALYGLLQTLLITGELRFGLDLIMIISCIALSLAALSLIPIFRFRGYYGAFVILHRKFKSDIKAAKAPGENVPALTKGIAVGSVRIPDPLTTVGLQKLWLRRFMKKILKKEIVPAVLSIGLVVSAYILPRMGAETEIFRAIIKALPFISLIAAHRLFIGTQYLMFLDRSFDRHLITLGIAQDPERRRKLFMRRLGELSVLSLPSLLALIFAAWQFSLALGFSLQMRALILILIPTFVFHGLCLQMTIYHLRVFRLLPRSRDKLLNLAPIFIQIFACSLPAYYLLVSRQTERSLLLWIVLFLLGLGINLSYYGYKSRYRGRSRRFMLE